MLAPSFYLSENQITYLYHGISRGRINRLAMSVRLERPAPAIVHGDRGSGRSPRPQCPHSVESPCPRGWPRAVGPSTSVSWPIAPDLPTSCRQESRECP